MRDGRTVLAIEIEMAMVRARQTRYRRGKKRVVILAVKGDAEASLIIKSHDRDRRRARGRSIRAVQVFSITASSTRCADAQVASHAMNEGNDSSFGNSVFYLLCYAKGYLYLRPLLRYLANSQNRSHIPTMSFQGPDVPPSLCISMRPHVQRYPSRSQISLL